MRYRDGTEALEGDVVVVTHGKSRELGMIKKVILPASADASDWSLPEGGVLIEGGGLGLFTTASIEQDEDIAFVSRATSTQNRYGKQPGR